MLNKKIISGSFYGHCILSLFVDLVIKNEDLQLLQSPRCNVKVRKPKQKASVSLQERFETLYNLLDASRELPVLDAKDPISMFLSNFYRRCELTEFGFDFKVVNDKVQGNKFLVFLLENKTNEKVQELINALRKRRRRTSQHIYKKRTHPNRLNPRPILKAFNSNGV